MPPPLPCLPPVASPLCHRPWGRACSGCVPPRAGARWGRPGGTLPCSGVRHSPSPGMGSLLRSDASLWCTTLITVYVLISKCPCTGYDLPVPSPATLGLGRGNHCTGVVRTLVGVGCSPHHGSWALFARRTWLGKAVTLLRRVGVLSQMQQLSGGCSPKPIPGAQGRRGFSPGSRGSRCSQTVAPSLLLGTWLSLASPAHEKAGASLQLPLAWARPRQPHPSFDSRCLFSLPVCPANSLPWTHSGLLCHRLVSLPATCMLPGLPKLIPVHLPQHSHTSQALSRPRHLVSHVPSPSRARRACCCALSLMLRISTAPSFLQSPHCPGLDTFPSRVKAQEAAYSSPHGPGAFAQTCAAL